MTNRRFLLGKNGGFLCFLLKFINIFRVRKICGKSVDKFFCDGYNTFVIRNHDKYYIAEKFGESRNGRI